MLLPFPLTTSSPVKIVGFFAPLLKLLVSEGFKIVIPTSAIKADGWAALTPFGGIQNIHRAPLLPQLKPVPLYLPRLLFPCDHLLPWQPQSCTEQLLAAGPVQAAERRDRRVTCCARPPTAYPSSRARHAPGFTLASDPKTSA